MTIQLNKFVTFCINQILNHFFIGCSNVLVYKLGGTSLSVTVIEVNSGIYRVLATKTYDDIGGVCFTEALAQYLASEFQRYGMLKSHSHVYYSRSGSLIYWRFVLSSGEFWRWIIRSIFTPTLNSYVLIRVGSRTVQQTDHRNITVIVRGSVKSHCNILLRTQIKVNWTDSHGKSNISGSRGKMYCMVFKYLTWIFAEDFTRPSRFLESWNCWC